jgi:hypothetical protein
MFEFLPSYKTLAWPAWISFYGYMIYQLKYMRDGSRENHITQPIAEKLTIQQIRDVAAYLSRLYGD